MGMETLEAIQQEFSHELFLYPWDIFELRIQEEMVRADRSGSGFGYMEVPFSVLRDMVRPTVDENSMYRTLLKFVSVTMRGSDIKGFLSGNSGLGLVFLDADREGVLECRTRLIDRLRSLEWLVDSFDEVASKPFKITFYPLEQAP